MRRLTKWIVIYMGKILERFWKYVFYLIIIDMLGNESLYGTLNIFWIMIPT